MFQENHQKLNILIHMGDCFPGNNPNAKRMKAFYDVLSEKGHAVKILAPKGKGMDNHKDVVYAHTVPLKSKSTVNRMFNQVLYGCTSFAKSFRAGKADVVLTTTPPALLSPFGWLIAKCKGAKLVYDVRDIWPDVALEIGSFSEKSIYARVFAAVRDFMLRHSDLITAVGEEKSKKLKTLCPEANVVTIPNGLDELFLDYEADNTVSAKYKMDEAFTCVYIGNMGIAQDTMALVKLAERAAKEQIPMQLLLFGKGVREQELRDYVQKNAVPNVVFGGEIEPAEVYSVLKNADLCTITLANKNMIDSVPTKMFEAIGVGCPVLLYASGESADILKNSGIGLSVDPGDEDKLWEAFMYMFKNRDDFVSKRDFARQFILEHYSRQKSAVKLEECLRSLISDKEKNPVPNYREERV